MGFLKEYLSKISCHHEWERHKVVQLYENEDASLPIRTIEVLICKKCGKIKKITI